MTEVDSFMNACHALQVAIADAYGINADKGYGLILTVPVAKKRLLQKKKKVAAARSVKITTGKKAACKKVACKKAAYK